MLKKFSNSKGESFENERDYVLSEVDIQRKMILSIWDKFTRIIKNNPEYYYEFIKEIGNEIIDKKSTKDDLQKQFDNVNDIFKKEMKIKTDDYNNSGEGVEYEPYLWGNDMLDGHDINC